MDLPLRGLNRSLGSVSHTKYIRMDNTIRKIKSVGDKDVKNQIKDLNKKRLRTSYLGCDKIGF